MSRLKPRPRADHAHVAAMARRMPGTEVLAGTYNSGSTAASVAWQVCTGRNGMPAYQPAGSFEARTELTQDGADLYIRYVGAPAEGVAR